MRKIRLLALLNLLALGVHLMITWLIQQKMINDTDVSEISHAYPSLFTPVNTTFAIWGLIYLLLIVFCIYHVFVSWKYSDTHRGNRDTLRMGALFIINNLLTAAWLYYWTHAYLLAALMLIFLQWVTLFAIHRRIGIYDRDAGLPSKLFTQPALSIYLGWITVATIANAASFLNTTGWDGGFSETTWTLAFIGLAVFAGLCLILIRRNVFVGLVVIWALTGIVVKPYPEISLGAEIGIIVTGLACVLQLARNISYFSRFKALSHAGL